MDKALREAARQFGLNTTTFGSAEDLVYVAEVTAFQAGAAWERKRILEMLRSEEYAALEELYYQFSVADWIEGRLKDT